MTQYEQYLQALKRPFQKLTRVRFLNPDGSTAFALDNNPLNGRSRAFVADGNVTMNFQNGQRRTASVKLSNLNREFGYNVNNLWFGQEIALDMGLVLPDGTEYYLPMGVFEIDSPKETLLPNGRFSEFSLVDKWCNLDGTLGGNLDASYEVPLGTNIFTAMQAVLDLDRGNGRKVDSVHGVYTDYFNGETTTLTNGTAAPIVNTPHTLTIDNSGTQAAILTGLAEMLACYIGYDATGQLRVEPSNDDILDTDKPVMWEFSPKDVTFLGATYSIKNREVFNDVVVWGETLDQYDQPRGRAQNLDPASDTNVNLIGRKTKLLTSNGYYTDKQCEDLAVWKLKRFAVLQKSVEISCSQMFHLQENSLVAIHRTDKPGAPLERHLIQGYSIPLSAGGAMTLTAISVNDLPIATIVSPEQK